MVYLCYTFGFLITCFPDQTKRNNKYIELCVCVVCVKTFPMTLILCYVLCYEIWHR